MIYTVIAQPSAQAESDRKLLEQQYKSSFFARKIFCWGISGKLLFAVVIKIIFRKELYLILDHAPAMIKDHEAGGFRGFVFQLCRSMIFKHVNKIFTSSAILAFMVRRYDMMDHNRIVVCPNLLVPAEPSRKTQSNNIYAVMRDPIDIKTIKQLTRISRQLPNLSFYILGNLNEDIVDDLLQLPDNCIFTSVDHYNWALTHCSLYLELNDNDYSAYDLQQALNAGLVAVSVDLGVLPELSSPNLRYISSEESDEIIGQTINNALHSLPQEHHGESILSECSGNKRIERFLNEACLSHNNIT